MGTYLVITVVFFMVLSDSIQLAKKRGEISASLWLISKMVPRLKKMRRLKLKMVLLCWSRKPSFKLQTVKV